MVDTKDSEGKRASKEEIDSTINTIFDEMNKALSQEEKHKVTLERVDETLNALFDAINRAQKEGKSAKIPDFKKILTGE